MTEDVDDPETEEDDSGGTGKSASDQADGVVAEEE
jgi:hypothetical protein